MSSAYETAQVCLKGHIVNELALTNPAANQQYCGKCGERTMMACASCGAAIRGPLAPGDPCFFVNNAVYQPPAHCHQCGRWFPWAWRLVAIAILMGVANNVKKWWKRITTLLVGLAAVAAVIRRGATVINYLGKVAGKMSFWH